MEELQYASIPVYSTPLVMELVEQEEAIEAIIKLLNYFGSYSTVVERPTPCSLSMASSLNTCLLKPRLVVVTCSFIKAS